LVGSVTAQGVFAEERLAPATCSSPGGVARVVGTCWLHLLPLCIDLGPLPSPPL
jgi:hypothetical protein